MEYDLHHILPYFLCWPLRSRLGHLASPVGFFSKLYAWIYSRLIRDLNYNFFYLSSLFSLLFHLSKWTRLVTFVNILWNHTTYLGSFLHVKCIKYMIWAISMDRWPVRFEILSGKVSLEINVVWTVYVSTFVYSCCYAHLFSRFIIFSWLFHFTLFITIIGSIVALK